MKFSASNPAVPKTDGRDPFQFTPSPASIALGQAAQISNTVSDGDDLHTNDLAQNVEALLVHDRKLPQGK